MTHVPPDPSAPEGPEPVTPPARAARRRSHPHLEVTPQELITQIAALTGLSAEQSESALTALLDSAATELREQRETILPGLGTFTVRERRAGRTGAPVHVTFRISSTFERELALATPGGEGPGGAQGGVPALRPDKVKV
jgi:nucleoid DNA-binding protein